MDKAKKGDEHLDMEYLNTLRNIKPYITCIMNNHYIELVRVWLEKLSDTKVENKALRNEYLVELGKQIVSGIFVEPFVDPPGPGPLRAFKATWKNQSIEVTRASPNPWVQAANRAERSHFAPAPAKPDDTVAAPSPETVRKSAQERLDEVRENISRMHQRARELNGRAAPKRRRSRLKGRAAPRAQPEFAQQLRPGALYPVLAPPFSGVYDGPPGADLYVPLGKVPRGPPGDESSWLDLTDNVSATLTAFGSGDATPRLYDASGAYERKIAGLMGVIAELKEENDFLNRHVDKYQKDLRNTKAETSIHNLATEVECLKTRLQELVDIKASLQSNKYAAATEWQNAVSTLQRKLALLQRRYNDLKLENNELIKRLEAEADRRKEAACQKQKLTEFHGRETDMLKEVHARAITELEAKFNRTMADLEAEYSAKLNGLRDSHDHRLAGIKEEFDHRNAQATADYEAKSRSLQAEYEERLSQKDAEIDKLEQLLQEQCTRMQEEVQVIRNQIESNVANSGDSYMEKIAFLQRCIVKMERLYQKAERENAKQVIKLRKELEYKTKTNQLALTTQKAELLAGSFDGRQTEVEQIFAELEDHYRDIIVEQQRKALEEKRNDAKIIEDLKAELAKCKSDY